MAEENKSVVRRLARAINSGNLDDLDHVLAPNYVRHDPNPIMKDIGREEYKQAFLSLRHAFPDAEWRIEELLSDGDRVIGRGPSEARTMVRSSTLLRLAKKLPTQYSPFIGLKMEELLKTGIFSIQ